MTDMRIDHAKEAERLMAVEETIPIERDEDEARVIRENVTNHALLALEPAVLEALQRYLKDLEDVEAHPGV